MMKWKIFAIATSCAITLLFLQTSASSFSFISLGDAGPLDGLFPIQVDDTLEEIQPVIAYNRIRNEYLVVWRNDRPGNDDIRGVRLAADGKALGSPFYISAGTGAERINPDVAFDYTNDQYLVVWEQYDTNFVNCLGIYGRRVAGTGSVIGTSDILIHSVTEDTLRVSSPAVDYAYTSDNFLVVWSEYVSWIVDYEIILGRILSSDGTLPDPAFWISPGSGTYFTGHPDVAYNRHADRFLVVWECTFDLANWDIYGQQVHGTGGLYGSPITIAYYTVPTTDPKVAAIPTAPGNEKFLVVFETHYSTSDHDVYGKVISEEGVVVTPLSDVYIADSTKDETSPQVSGSEKNNTYLVIWYEDELTIKSREVLFDSTFAPTSKTIASNIYSPVFYRLMSVTAGNAGDYLIAFSDYSDVSYDIFGKLYGLRTYLPLVIK